MVYDRKFVTKVELTQTGLSARDQKRHTLVLNTLE